MNSLANRQKRVLAVFGVGLIGGSLALRLKKEGVVDHVIGVGRSSRNLERALQTRAIDEIAADVDTAASRANILVLATPVNSIVDLLTGIAPNIKAEAIVTDVGSVKKSVMDAARAVLGDRISRFVPGHPIAGKEKSGIIAADHALFENHKVILTPDCKTDPKALDSIKQLWQSCGAEVVLMSVEEHDRVLSVTSHLPHILAYVMMDLLASHEERDRCYEMAAGGFYDFTRTASSDPEMWRDISLMNSEQLLAGIKIYKNRLEDVGKMIESMDGDHLQALFTEARKARSHVSERRRY